MDRTNHYNIHMEYANFPSGEKITIEPVLYSKFGNNGKVFYDYYPNGNLKKIVEYIGDRLTRVIMGNIDGKLKSLNIYKNDTLISKNKGDGLMLTMNV